MKLEARERLRAYRRVPNQAMFVPQSLTLQEALKKGKEIKNAFPASSGWKLFDNSWDDQYIFLLWKDDHLHGDFLFETDSKPAEILSSVFKRQFAVPHVSLSKEAAGTGIATQLYKIALRQGVSFVTSGHTEKAMTLWDRLAKLPGVYSYHVDLNGNQVAEGPKSLRILTGKQI
jgi:hypothetical protein